MTTMTTMMMVRLARGSRKHFIQNIMRKRHAICFTWDTLQKNKLIINCYRDMSRAVKNSVIVHTIAIMKIPKFIVTLFLNRTLCFLLQIMSLLMPFVTSLSAMLRFSSVFSYSLAVIVLKFSCCCYSQKKRAQRIIIIIIIIHLLTHRCDTMLSHCC